LATEVHQAFPERAAPQAPRPPEEVLGVVALAALVLITLANVVVRYVTDRSFAWTEEISVFLLVVLTLAGVAAAAIHDGHIRIEFFYRSGSVTRQRWLALLSAAATAAMFGILCVLIVRSGLQEYEFGDTTMGLGLPRWWYTMWLPGLALMVAIRAAVRGWRQSREVQSEEPKA
jgi:TRAP-type C4-dicarboxylate transport system permease small subunit